jgi:hypothetical protein
MYGAFDLPWDAVRTDEETLRRLAARARALLLSLISDVRAAARIDADLTRALALPVGHAKQALIGALFSHPGIDKWVVEQPDWDEEPPVDVAGARPVPRDQPVSRYLGVDIPERAPIGTRFSVHVRISQHTPPGVRSVGLTATDVPPGDAVVTITVSAPALIPTGDLEQDLRVPAHGDSEPVRFGFRTGRAGLHTVVVRAFRGGTFLGELSARVAVRSGTTIQEDRRQFVDLVDLTQEPGEVTLLVTPDDDDRYSFQLRGDGMDPLELSQRLAGKPGRVVGMIVDDLRRMASGSSPYQTRELRYHHLRNLGVNLWADAVPEAIRRQFWAHIDGIRCLTVASDTDTVPWELLYPLDGHNDNGFLVRQFPVVRRVPGQRRARTLPLRSAAYVVPPHAPSDALAEVAMVRERLGGRVPDSALIERLGELLAVLADPPGLLHFACHNDFEDETGSVVRLADGPLRPVDLAATVQSAGLADASPLVFFNACRTAGQIPGMLKMMGWAQQFMAAGAGAFLGSLWAVRSSSAREFADAFYDSFVSRRLPLGEASLAARRHIAAQDGDPSWLAYTVYGNPSATLAD